MGWILAAEGPNGFWIPGDVKEFWYGGAAFLIVFLLFLWKGVPAFKEMMANRTKRIEEQLSVAQKAQADADARIAEQKAKFANVDAEARQIVSDATSQAAKLKADSVGKIEADIAALRGRADVEIASMRNQAAADIQATMSTRALAAAEAVVQDNLDDATQVELIEQYISQVGASS